MHIIFLFGFHEFNLIEFESNLRIGIQLNKFKFNSIQVACNFHSIFSFKMELNLHKVNSFFYHFIVIGSAKQLGAQVEWRSPHSFILKKLPPMIMKELWLIVKPPKTMGILSTVYIINLSFNSLFYGFFPLKHRKG